MIQKVRLKNWRSHEDSELYFDGGTNALLGIIGSGKSSVLDAICFCLFGTFPTLQGRKLKLDDILTKRPVGKSRAEVEVYFSENGKNYSVKRVIEAGRGTTYSEVKENGKTVESPNTSRVNELVEKILKVNYDLFSKAIYSEQNSMDYFLTIPRGQRMKKIDELLMIDRFEKARTSAVALVNKLSEKREVGRAVIEKADLDEAEKALEDMRASMEKMASEGSELAEKAKALERQRSSVEKEMGDVRKIRSRLEELRREEKGVASVVEDTARSLEDMEKVIESGDSEAAERSLREVSRNLGDMERAFADEQNGYMKLQNQFTKSRTEVEIMKREKLDLLEDELGKRLEAQKALEKRKVTPEKMESQMDEKKKAVEKFITEMEVAKMKVRELKEAVEELDKIDGKCPVCSSKISEEKKAVLLNKKKFEIEKMKERFVKAGERKEVSERQLAELEESAGRLEEMLESVKDIGKVRAELENARSVYQVLKEQSDKFEKEISSMKAGIESMQERMSQARERKSTLESQASRMKEYASKKSKIESLLRDRRGIESRISELQESISGKGDEKLDALWKDLVTQEKEISGRLGTITELRREKASRSKEIESQIGAARKELAGVKRLEGSIEQMKIFENALRETQSQLRREFVTSVNHTMNELWPNLYPYRDFTGVQLSVEDGDYVLQLQEGSGNWINVEGFASGGERSIAALTLRMAFALVLAPQLKWLVLDEPTANMDAKAVEDLSTTLSEHIGNFIDQTFLITHDEKLEKAVTGHAYRLERDKAKNGFTRVVQL